MENQLVKITTMPQKVKSKTPCYLYTRVSSVKQEEDGLSLNYQEDNAQLYCERNNLEIVKVYKIAESAKKAKRKIFNEMLADALKNGIHNLIFKSTDRFSRNYTDLVKIEELITKNNFTIHFYQSNKYINKLSNHDEKMILGMEITIAKHLTDKISYDIKQSYNYRAGQGTPPGQPPIGYKYDKANHKWIKDENTKDTLKFIFDYYDNHECSLSEMCEVITSKGIKTPKEGNWTPPYLHRTLRKSVYAGFFTYEGKKITANHEAYTDENRYYERLKKLNNKYKAKIKTENDFVFRGLIACGTCGRIMSGQTVKHKYIYYGHRGEECENNYWNEDWLFELVDKEMSRQLLSETFFEEIKKAIKLTIEDRRKNVTNDNRSVSKRISDIETKKQKLLNLYLDGDVDRNSYMKKFNELNLNIKDLENEKQAIQTLSDEFTFDILDIVDTFRTLPNLYKEGDKGQRGRIIKGFVQKITVFDKEGERRIKLEYQKPYSLFMEKVLIHNQMHVFSNDFKTIIEQFVDEYMYFTFQNNNFGPT